MIRTTDLDSISEAEFQAQVVELATIMGWQHLHVRRTIGRGRKWTTSTNLAGWPDLFLWKPGRTLAVELKSETGALTPKQFDVLCSLTEAGITSRVWRPRDWDAIKEALR